MRVIISAIALIFVIGIALPTPADARSPRKVEKWGCTIKAERVTVEAMFPDRPAVWYGRGSIGRCDKPQRFNVTIDILLDIPSGRNRVHSREKYTNRRIGRVGGSISTVGGGECTADGRSPTRYPTYVRMKVRRTGKPGVIRVAGHNTANPCKGVEDIPWISGR